MAGSMPNDFSNDAGPIPDSCRICAECNAPPAMMTSLRARTVWRGAEAFSANCTIQQAICHLKRNQRTSTPLILSDEEPVSLRRVSLSPCTGALPLGLNPKPSEAPDEFPLPFSLPVETGSLTLLLPATLSISTRVTCCPVMTWRFFLLTAGSKYARRASDRVWFCGWRSVGTKAAPAQLPSFGSNSVGTPRELRPANRFTS